MFEEKKEDSTEESKEASPEVESQKESPKSEDYELKIKELEEDSIELATTGFIDHIKAKIEELEKNPESAKDIINEIEKFGIVSIKNLAIEFTEEIKGLKNIAKIVKIKKILAKKFIKWIDGTSKFKEGSNKLWIEKLKIELDRDLTNYIKALLRNLSLLL